MAVPDRCLCLAALLLFALPLAGQTKQGEPRPRTAEQALHMADETLRAVDQAVPRTSEQSAAAIPTSTKESEVPEVPGLSSLLKGFNAGLTIFGVHDHYTGWGTAITPALGYAFNDHFSADVSVPIYFFRLAPTTKARPKPNALLVPTRGEMGDVVLAGHMHFAPQHYEYQATAALAIPTGDAKDGLTTGLTAFDFTNHFDVPFWKLTPNLDIGLGDNASLVNRVSTKNYQPSLGPLSHYQLGMGVSLPLGASFDVGAYEQLPIGDQKTYTPLPRDPKTLVVTGHKIFEDNGIMTSLEIAMGGHMTFSGYYNRSTRYHTDTVAVGYTYVLRGAPPPSEIPDATIDELIRSETTPPPAPKP